MDAFYIQESNDLFVPTEHTRGPWDLGSQHGGPPAALLGRALDRDDDKQVARISFDILKPVPVTPLTLKTKVVRPGKRVDLVEGALLSDGHPVMRASAWRIRIAEIAIGSNGSPNPHPGPAEGREPTGYFTDHGADDYLHAMEWRFLTNEFLEPGPSVAWLRMRMPLLEGEAPSPLTRVLIAADSASGISSELDPKKWLFINPDLNVGLDRMPEGEWICLDARTVVQPHGIGLARSTIYDERGDIGGSTQSLLIDERR
ncbi:MAG: thioesterase family protein [Actinomycetota bacterium]